MIIVLIYSTILSLVLLLATWRSIIIIIRCMIIITSTSRGYMYSIIYIYIYIYIVNRYSISLSLSLALSLYEYIYLSMYIIARIPIGETSVIKYFTRGVKFKGCFKIIVGEIVAKSPYKTCHFCACRARRGNSQRLAKSSPYAVPPAGTCTEVARLRKWHVWCFLEGSGVPAGAGVYYTYIHSYIHIYTYTTMLYCSIDSIA